VGQLPDPLGLALLDIAREAFVKGLHLAATISAAVAIGAAIMAVVFLRGVPARGEPEAEPEPQLEMKPDGAVPGSAGVD
jgi:DHA2 family multidrug resistance protein-like MFS transporter